MLAVSALALLGAITAHAQEVDEVDAAPDATPTAEPDTPLLPDPVFWPPEPEGIANPVTDLRTYAGIGGEWAYGDAGTAEVGGSVSFSTSMDATRVSADPMIGFFLIDRLELSLIGEVRYARVRRHSTTRFGLTVEPSAHIPITSGLLWMAGVGIGGAVGKLANEQGPGAALVAAPRTGIQVLLGRSGVMNLGARYQILFPDADADPVFGQPELAFANTFDLLAGYSVVF